ncbi:type II secretion system major pseudopilin GspG [bacterium]|nr:type II secretion system major pseudopilin GspG [bacterium]
MIRTKTSRGRGGFTLVELLLVMVILATLAAIVIPKVAGRGEQANVTAAQTQIAVFAQQLDAFEVDCGYFPSTSDGLDVLVNQPRDTPKWRGPYLKEIPTDPYGTPYVYEYPGKNNPNSYDIYSCGPDKRPGGGDDITEKGSEKDLAK